MRRLPIYTVIALLPTIMALILIRHYFHTDLTSAMPIWSDEQVYWLEINAFRAANFNTGYFTIGEMSALPGFTHYGSHGFLHALIFGGLARVFGWTYASLPVYHAVLLAISFFIFLVVTRPAPVQLILLAVLAVTWWPVLLYFPTSMMEIVFHAFALLLGAIFALILRGRATTRLVLVAVLVIIPAALMRITWVFLIIPLILLWINDLPNRRIRHGAMALGVIALFLGLNFIIYLRTVPEFPFGFLPRLKTVMATDLSAGLTMLTERIITSLNNLFRGEKLELLVRALTAGLLAFSGLSYSMRLRQRFTWMLTVREAWTLVLVLGVVLAINIALYDINDWRNFRLLAPYAFWGILLLIAVKRVHLSTILVVINLIGLIGFGTTLVNLHGTRFSAENLPMLQRVQPEVNALLQYNPETVSGWCNTVLIRDYQFPLVTLPAGMGMVSYYTDAEADPPPLRSRYILATTADWIAQIGGDLEFLGSTSIGDFYLNRATACQR